MTEETPGTEGQPDGKVVTGAAEEGKPEDGEEDEGLDTLTERALAAMHGVLASKRLAVEEPKEKAPND